MSYISNINTSLILSNSNQDIKVQQESPPQVTEVAQETISSISEQVKSEKSPENRSTREAATQKPTISNRKRREPKSKPIYDSRFFFYKIKKRISSKVTKTVGYILGSAHVSNMKGSLLNEKILNAVDNSVVYDEDNIKTTKLAFEIALSKDTVTSLNVEIEKCRENKEEMKRQLSETQQEYQSKQNVKKDPAKKQIPYPPASGQLKPEFGTESVLLKLKDNNFNDIAALETPEESARAVVWGEIMSEVLPNSATEASQLISAVQWGDDNFFLEEHRKRKQYAYLAEHEMSHVRNKNMAARGATLIREEANPQNRVMLVVGAAHLAGNKSFQNHLKQNLGRDYSIHRVENNG